MPPYSDDKAIDRSIGRKVLIDQSKQQQISLISGFRGVARHLKSVLTVEINTEPISLSGLDDVRMLIIPQPKSALGTGEIETIWKFVEEGGALMILSGEGGERQSLNELVAKYGIVVNKDSVIRTVFLKYFDPKEALVANGVVNRSIAAAAKKNVSTEQKQNSQSLSFIYPFGSTLTVTNRSSTIVLSSGSTSFPTSRPVAAFHETKPNELNKQGRVCVVGSVSMFHDTYIDKEENGKIFDTIVDYLINGFDLNTIDAAEPEIHDYINIPDHIHMSQQIKVCMYEGELDSAVSSDFMKILDNSLNSVSLKHWPMTLRLYEALSLSPPPLTIVEPQFDLPMPPFTPAVFPPLFQELPMPTLELFDLDELFSSPETQLSQLANRSEETDLSFFIEKAGEITGLSSELSRNDRTPKRIMELALNKLMMFKRSMMDGELDVDMSGFDVQEDHHNLEQNYLGNDEMDDQLFSDIDEFDDL
uniref:Intraflagellar transport protein 52 homolog n=1 Tax=Caenorhabditis japonica TaxID=281687 RepID=A0A8R1DNE7_CAEJA